MNPLPHFGESNINSPQLTRSKRKRVDGAGMVRAKNLDATLDTELTVLFRRLNFSNMHIASEQSVSCAQALSYISQAEIAPELRAHIATRLGGMLVKYPKLFSEYEREQFATSSVLLLQAPQLAKNAQADVTTMLIENPHIFHIRLDDAQRSFLLDASFALLADHELMYERAANLPITIALNILTLRMSLDLAHGREFITRGLALLNFHDAPIAPRAEFASALAACIKINVLCPNDEQLDAFTDASLRLLAESAVLGGQRAQLVLNLIDALMLGRLPLTGRQRELVMNEAVRVFPECEHTPQYFEAVLCAIVAPVAKRVLVITPTQLDTFFTTVHDTLQRDTLPPAVRQNVGKQVYSAVTRGDLPLSATDAAKHIRKLHAQMPALADRRRGPRFSEMDLEAVP